MASKPSQQRQEKGTTGGPEPKSTFRVDSGRCLVQIGFSDANSCQTLTTYVGLHIRNTYQNSLTRPEFPLEAASPMTPNPLSMSLQPVLFGTFHRFAEYVLRALFFSHAYDVGTFYILVCCTSTDFSPQKLGLKVTSLALKCPRALDHANPARRYQPKEPLGHITLKRYAKYTHQKML